MEGSWGSESVLVPDADTALALLCAELAPGRRGAGEGVQLGRARCARRRGGVRWDRVRRMKQILVAVAIALAVSIVLTPGTDPAVHPAGLRP